MRRHLPVLVPGGGEQEPRFVNIRGKEAQLAVDVAALNLGALLGWNLLSANGKTTVSLDFPIGHTCQPTELCASSCYASRPGATTAWKKSLRKRLRNLRYFQLEETGRAVERLSKEFARKQRFWAKRGLKLDFFRINGTGDLFPEIIPVINGFAAANPDVSVWIVTRQFSLAARILALPNIFLQLSLDSTTPAELVEVALRLVATHPRTYLSFLRAERDDDTLGAAIIFNEKGTDGLPFSGVTDCPVDAGKLPLGNERGVGGTACSKCRKCFSERTLAQQRGSLEARRAPLALPAEEPLRLVQADSHGRLHLRLADPAAAGARVRDAEPTAWLPTAPVRSVEAIDGAVVVADAGGRVRHAVG